MQINLAPEPMNRQLKSSNIYLIGMMGSGKTTVGKLLAEKLNYGFIDTDDLIEKSVQKTIAEIFASEGEARFRELESQTLSKVSNYGKSAFTEGVPLAIATGGGIIEQPENWNYLRQGLTIWLDADLNLLHQRLTEDRSRPLISQLESLLATRRCFYAQADLQIAIEPEQTPEDIVAEIINKLYLRN
ncbi:MAG: shikimate kinase [Pleurocapsa sp. MO_226.B13]|nr:shikimate kinase [Pleurocapsa sp. MO_226.B13]